jgi:hypothetical protein
MTDTALVWALTNSADGSFSVIAVYGTTAVVVTDPKLEMVTGQWFSIPEQAHNAAIRWTHSAEEMGRALTTEPHPIPLGPGDIEDFQRFRQLGSGLTGLMLLRLYKTLMRQTWRTVGHTLDGGVVRVGPAATW